MRKFVVSSAALALAAGLASGAGAQNTQWWMPNASTHSCVPAADNARKYNDPNVASPYTLRNESGYQETKTYKDKQGNLIAVVIVVRLHNGTSAQVAYFPTADGCQSFIKATAQSQ